MTIKAVWLFLVKFIPISLIYPSAFGRYYLISWSETGEIGRKIKVNFFLSEIAKDKLNPAQSEFIKRWENIQMNKKTDDQGNNNNK